MFTYIRTAADSTEWPRWVLMWMLATAIYATCKALTWATANASNVPGWKHAAYLLAWPGMDAAAFLETKPRTPCCPRSEWIRAASHLILGTVLVFVVAGRLPAGGREGGGWVGSSGLGGGCL